MDVSESLNHVKSHVPLCLHNCLCTVVSLLITCFSCFRISRTTISIKALTLWLRLMVFDTRFRDKRDCQISWLPHSTNRQGSSIVENGRGVRVESLSFLLMLQAQKERMIDLDLQTK